MENQTVPIFYAVDDNYAPYLAVSLASLVAHTSPDRHYQVIVLCDDLNTDNQGRLKAFETDNLKIQFVSINDRLKQEITDKNNKLRSDYFTFTIYFRLFIAELFPKLDKALYLDADTVVLKDVGELFDTQLGDNLVGAVPDPFVGHTPETIDYVEQAVGIDSQKYVCSGVLLMNLAEMRRLKFAEHFLQLLNKYHFKCLAPDQDYMNAIARNRIYYLNPSWHIQITTPQDVDPWLIHYNLFAKPWRYDDAPRQSYFWTYAKQTDYETMLKQQLADMNPKEVARDQKNQSDLIQLAVDIIKTPTTFYAMAKQGVKIAL
uniref:Putative LPS biosynthesis protein n=2 Tax=Lactobacillaceae TaxID=33958 RepID=A4UX81_9LACO|nr:putative LPS biosynthesis protein [Pediococcus inopinatus]BAF56894.1 putative LPS biosynthesis protein [Loigolactobacillus backii]